jgi:tetratricopeptide (TPR) repeat protein
MSVTDQDSPYSLHFWLAEFEEHNDWPAVRRTARQLLHLMPNHPEGLRYLAEAHFRLGEFEAAHSAALRLVNICPMCPDGFWILADVYAQADELERSVEFLEQAARRLPACDELWMETARAYFHLARWAKSLVAADHGLKINRCNVPLWILKVFCLSHLGRSDAARIAASRLIDLGVEADDLREASRRLGITGATLAAMKKTANGQAALKTSRSPSHSKNGVIAGVETLQKQISKRGPMSREEFHRAWTDAQSRKEIASETADHPCDRRQHDHHDLAADNVFYVYHNYRVWGPYSPHRLEALFRKGDFLAGEAWVRDEQSSHWLPAREIFPHIL